MALHHDDIHKRIGRRGRPLLYGDSARESRHKSYRRRDETKIYLSRAFLDWQIQKAWRYASARNGDFALHLLEIHAKFCRACQSGTP
eukprot:gene17777-19553_t